MRVSILLISLTLLSLHVCFSQQAFYDVTAVNGNGLRFWNASDYFKISMGNSSEYQYGPVTGYSIRSTMDNTPDRGWTWGIYTGANVAAISTSGDMRIAGSFKSTSLSVGPTLYDYLGSSDLGAIEFPRAEILYATTHTQNQLYLSANAYYNGGFKFRNSAPAAGVGIDAGSIFLWTAPSGSAGAPVTLNTQLTIANSGNVGIGTSSPNQKLTVNGTIYGKEVKVDLSVPGPDYVFEESYTLPSLEEVKSYIDENKHLPEVPSAKEMEKNGINLSEMNMLLLKKVEELTLYMIELKQENKRQLEKMQREINQLKK